jgi:hypothetical protein
MGPSNCNRGGCTSTVCRLVYLNNIPLIRRNEDERNIPALHRIGDPDDILASVLVRDSKIDPNTYQPMPSYRFCTSDGIIQLTPGVAQKLQTILKDTQREELGRAS